MSTDVEILLNQLKKQADAFEEQGEIENKNAIMEMINSINNIKQDNVNIKIEMNATLKKFDGDIEDGKEPVETINL